MISRFNAPLSAEQIGHIAEESAAEAGRVLFDFVGETHPRLAADFARDLLVEANGDSPPRVRELTVHAAVFAHAARAAGLDVNELLVRVARYIARVERGVSRLRDNSPGSTHRRWIDTHELLSRSIIFSYHAEAFATPEELDVAMRALIVERSRVRELVRAASREMDTGTGAVIATDTTGTILYWNDAATTLYGWGELEVLGRLIVDVTPATHVKDQAAEIMRTLAQGESWMGSFAVRDRNGVAMLVDVVDIPVRDRDTIVGVVGISTPTIAR